MKLITTVAFLCLVTAITATSRIFGGKNAPLGKYPYQVALKKDGRQYCGGSILNNYWILTAAHCIQGLNTKRLTVMTGSTFLEGERTGQHYNVQDAIVHDGFNVISSWMDDIGLIRVDREIQFSYRVQPVNLPNTDDVKVGTLGVLTGWGTSQFSSDPNELQEITLVVSDHEKCRNYWNITRKPYVVGKNQICTLNKRGEGSCRGDSGGPMVANGVQIGLTSFGEWNCAVELPDVYTKVYSYLDWINQQISYYENYLKVHSSN